jgi:hypothetical protein
MLLEWHSVGRLLLLLACTREDDLQSQYLQARQYMTSTWQDCRWAAAPLATLQHCHSHTVRAVHMAQCTLGDLLPGHPVEHTAFCGFWLPVHCRNVLQYQFDPCRTACPLVHCSCGAIATAGTLRKGRATVAVKRTATGWCAAEDPARHFWFFAGTRTFHCARDAGWTQLLLHAVTTRDVSRGAKSPNWFMSPLLFLLPWLYPSCPKAHCLGPLAGIIVSLIKLSEKWKKKIKPLIFLLAKSIKWITSIKSGQKIDWFD